MAELGINLPGLITQLVNFLLLLGVLYALLYRPVLRMLDRRTERIKESMETAERVRQEAQRTEESVKQQLDKARQEGQAAIAQAMQVAERLRADEQEKARQEAEAYKSRAIAEIQRERDQAIDEVRRQFSDLALLAAEKVIQRSLDRTAHKELIEEVLQQGMAQQHQKS